MVFFCKKKKKIDINKIKKAMVRKSIFFKTTNVCVLTYTKFQVFSIILTSFRQGEEFYPSPTPTSKRDPKKPTKIRAKKPNRFLL